jgi:hypothetical protein
MCGAPALAFRTPPKSLDFRRMVLLFSPYHGHAVVCRFSGPARPSYSSIFQRDPSCQCGRPTSRPSKAVPKPAGGLLLCARNFYSLRPPRFERKLFLRKRRRRTIGFYVNDRKPAGPSPLPGRWPSDPLQGQSLASPKAPVWSPCPAGRAFLRGVSTHRGTDSLPSAHTARYERTLVYEQSPFQTRYALNPGKSPRTLGHLPKTGETVCCGSDFRKKPLYRKALRWSHAALTGTRTPLI